MKRKIGGLVLIALAHSVTWGGNIHTDAATCRLPSALKEECLNKCMPCHENSNAGLPLDIYVEGDEQLCEICHPAQSLQKDGTLLFRIVRGGENNHPVAIFYSPNDSKSLLIPSPSGPKFFTDRYGNNPKIHCSTCHDAHSRTDKLLRVRDSGSALCLACHIK